MKSINKNTARRIVAASWLLAGLFAISAQAAMADALNLSGEQEVPPVTTAATGTGSIAVAADGSVTGLVTTLGLTGTAAHIHLGAAGANGPVIIPLTKATDNVWSVPPGTKLNANQLQAYRAGGLYVNVHTEANKGGEIRTQLKP